MSSSSRRGGSEWASAKDPKTDRVYYYNTRTKETTWNKPLEMASPKERAEMLRKRAETISFFREMENNIRSKVQNNYNYNNSNNYNNNSSTSNGNSNSPSGRLSMSRLSSSHNSNGNFGSYSGNNNSNSNGRVFSQSFNRQSSSEFNRPASVSRYFRTISSMDDDMLTTLHRLQIDTPDNSNSTDRNSFCMSSSYLNNSNSYIYGSPSNERGSFIMNNMNNMNNSGGRNSFGSRNNNLNNNNFNNSNNSRQARNSVSRNSVSSSLLHENPVDKLRQKSSQDSPRERLLENPNNSTKISSSPGGAASPISPNNNLYSNKSNLVNLTSSGNKRRNSTGTIYIGSTMSVQDNEYNESTIKCVCVVIRTHMIDAAKEGVEPLPQFDIFKDNYNSNNYSHNNNNNNGINNSSGGNFKDNSGAAGNDFQKIPSLSTVKDFFNLVFRKSQLESECIIIALIYCERLVKATKGKLCIRYDNWKSILFACLVMASKVWDDLSMWNVDFSQVSSSFDLQRINALELAILGELKYTIRVPASEYAKYYFHLRSMMARLGFHANEMTLLEPLNIVQARKLQLATEKFSNDNNTFADANFRPRSKTIDLQNTNNNNLSSKSSSTSDKNNKNSNSTKNSSNSAKNVNSSNKSSSSKAALVGLEQLIHSQHMDADGMTHTSRKNKNKNFTNNNGNSGNNGNNNNVDLLKKGAIPIPNNTAGANNSSSSAAKFDSSFDELISRKAFRTVNCASWNAGDDEDFKYTRK